MAERGVCAFIIMLDDDDDDAVTNAVVGLGVEDRVLLEMRDD